MVVSFDELDTVRDRTEGAVESLTAAGFPAERVFKAPAQKLEIPTCIDAASTLLVQQPAIKNWLICGGNDTSVLGGVRATESRGFAPANVIGIGINGTDCIPEFRKDKPTGFHASVLLLAREHGYKTAEMLYKWVKDGVEPPLDTRTAGMLITRDTFEKVRAEQGIQDSAPGPCRSSSSAACRSSSRASRRWRELISARPAAACTRSWAKTGRASPPCSRS